MKTQRFERIELRPTGELYRGDEWQPVAGTAATVTTIGEVRQRSTLTRVVAGGLVAGPLGVIGGALLRKSTDDREHYLFITGSIDWTVPVKQYQLKDAQRFALLVNEASVRHTRLEAEASR
ncbi:MAG: hypothetical protein EKK42_20340 [Pseudonocardiaceae bacterium]|nr:MAG: hypothetical protein EKK42_20340 [Pseudonocardiaceae bacterium]